MKKNINFCTSRSFLCNKCEPKAVFPVLGKLFICLFIFLNTNILISQNGITSNYKPGIGVGTHVSGNGYGAIYDVYGNLYNGKRVFSMGTCVQKRTGEISGFRFSYSRIVTGKEYFGKEENMSEDEIEEESEKIQLFFFSSIQYIHQSPLSFGAIEIEQKLYRVNDNRPINFSKIKLSTVELCGGFGINIKLSKHIVWGNFIGLSSFCHLTYTKGMYEDRIAVGLILGTNIGFNFFN